ncbi:MAG: nucleoside recognition domain-containing protein [Bacillota bacterium]|nr:nucleoside recognition domain-containing protein [Bacillota bacterium]
MFISLLHVVRELIVSALQTSLMLFKIIVPISILTRLLQQLGIVDYFGIILGPVMELVGLPGQIGLVWATAMITNIYGGMVVFASLAPGLDLTVAQVSVLGTMILVAHSLPVEGLIAQKAGTRLRATLLIRVMGALLIGWILHLVYQLTGVLQQTNQALWNPLLFEQTWSAWLLAELRNMFYIFLIILTLMAVLKIMKKLGVSDLMTRLLAPVLNILGISREAAPVAIIGMTLGLGYGGGLIIQEARTGNLSRRDLFASVTLMGLCHSIFEDTLLMMVLGAHLSGIFWARLIFSLLVIYLLVKLIRKLPDKILVRYLLSSVDLVNDKTVSNGQG